MKGRLWGQHYKVDWWYHGQHSNGRIIRLNLSKVHKIVIKCNKSVTLNFSCPQQFPAPPQTLSCENYCELRNASLFTPAAFSQGTIQLPLVCTDNLSLITYHSAIVRERKLKHPYLHLPLNDFELQYFVTTRTVAMLTHTNWKPYYWPLSIRYLLG